MYDPEGCTRGSENRRKSIKDRGIGRYDVRLIKGVYIEAPLIKKKVGITNLDGNLDK